MTPHPHLADAVGPSFARRLLLVGLALATLAGLGLVLPDTPPRHATAPGSASQAAPPAPTAADAPVASAHPSPVHPTRRAAVGDTVRTARERCRVLLPDGSILYLNHDTTLKVETERRLNLSAGETIDESDLIVQRPGTGISAADFAAAVGRRARTPLKAGTLLQWDMLTDAA